MSQVSRTASLPAQRRDRRAGEIRIIGTISAAHFVSHYFILLLPPLFPFIREEFGVNYTELGLAISAFNIISAVFQTPAGFLVDRWGARPILVAGLVLGAAAFAVAGLIPSFWVLVAMTAVAGLANTVYHPADYAILSHLISPERLGQAFSIHTFSGMLGMAAAPVTLLYLQSVIGWHGALLSAAVLGLAVAAIIAFLREPALDHLAPAAKSRVEGTSSGTVGWTLLLSPAILQNLVLFILLAITGGGLTNYAVVALAALYGTPLPIANAALSAFLLTNAVGVLVGGMLITRARHYRLVTAVGILTAGFASLLIGIVDLNTLLLMFAMSTAGLFNGAVMPARDMVVRDVTPAGSFGKVFGFVSTGFNIGGIIFPMMFGALMDHNAPRSVFLLVTACSIGALLVIAIGSRRNAIR